MHTTFSSDPDVFTPVFSDEEEYLEEPNLTISYNNDNNDKKSPMLQDVNFYEQIEEYTEESDEMIDSTETPITTNDATTISYKSVDVTANPTQVSRREMFQQRRADRRDRRKLCKAINDTNERNACLEQIRYEMDERNATRTTTSYDSLADLSSDSAQDYPQNNK